jgi:flavin-dependent dehydrogenase
LLIGEAARLTHNGTGEGFSQAMQSGMFGAEAVARVVRGQATEAASWRQYQRALQRRFTAASRPEHLLRHRGSNALDGLARTYNGLPSSGRFTG